MHGVRALVLMIYNLRPAVGGVKRIGDREAK